MTVEYFLAYLKPFYPQWDDARAMELLRQFDLSARSQAEASVARHADEGGAGIVTRVPAEVYRPG